MKKILTTSILLAAALPALVFAKSDFKGKCLISYEYDIEKTQEKIYEYTFSANSIEECKEDALISSEEDMSALPVLKESAGEIQMQVDFVVSEKIKINESKIKPQPPQKWPL